MARYPLVPGKLLDTADRLVPEDLRPGRPAYMDHRRGVSTAYYAVFRAIGDRVAKAVFTEADDDFLRKVERWIGHGEIVDVSRWVSQLGGLLSGSPPAHIVDLLEPRGASHIDRDTLEISVGFLELNDMREQADYDHEAFFTRTEALSEIELAKEVVARVEGTQTDAAKRYFGLIAMRSSIKKR